MIAGNSPSLTAGAGSDASYLEGLLSRSANTNDKKYASDTSDFLSVLDRALADANRSPSDETYARTHEDASKNDYQKPDAGLSPPAKPEKNEVAQSAHAGERETAEAKSLNQAAVGDGREVRGDSAKAQKRKLSAPVGQAGEETQGAEPKKPAPRPRNEKELAAGKAEALLSNGVLIAQAGAEGKTHAKDFKDGVAVGTADREIPAGVDRKKNTKAEPADREMVRLEKNGAAVDEKALKRFAEQAAKIEADPEGKRLKAVSGDELSLGTGAGKAENDAKTSRLQDALQVLKDVGKELGSNGLLVQNGARAADAKTPQGTSRGSREVLSPVENRIEQLRESKLGRTSTARVEKARFEASGAELQVQDLRGHAAKPVHLLDTLLSESRNPQAAANNAGLSGFKDEGARKLDGTGLQNTQFYTPAGEKVLGLPVNLVAESRAGFQQSLRDWMRSGGKDEIVQQARIIMQGEKSGEIRLILKPENLGEVRINLQLEDGRIAGTIFVENKDVQAVFEDELASLRQAFADGGLETGAFQVNVGASYAGAGQSGSDGDGDGGAFKRRRDEIAREKLADQVAVLQAYDADTKMVNVFV